MSRRKTMKVLSYARETTGDTCAIVSTLAADKLYAPLGTGGRKLIHA